MATRTSNKTVSFARPFVLKGVDRVLPAGEYRVATDEELIQELSFPVYRRVATMIFVPAEAPRSSSVEMVSIDPHDLQEALNRDAEEPANTHGRGAESESGPREKDGTMADDDGRIASQRSKASR
jgi:hypothetical protein